MIAQSPIGNKGAIGTHIIQEYPEVNEGLE